MGKGGRFTNYRIGYQLSHKGFSMDGALLGAGSHDQLNGVGCNG
jgi:hypothetical protein